MARLFRISDEANVNNSSNIWLKRENGNIVLKYLGPDGYESVRSEEEVSAQNTIANLSKDLTDLASKLEGLTKRIEALETPQDES
jgi:uncharacterized protein YlxW (UPF0749 family)